MPINPNGGCTTPSELLPGQAERQQLEREIERVIIGHFKTTPAARAIDDFTDPGTDGPRKVIDWLSRNSFGRPIDTALMKQRFDQGEYSVPDIITNRGSVAKSEFYEIKPNSDNGKREGFRKIADFEKLNKDFNLLFFPGEDYDPNQSIILASTATIASVEYQLELKWFREAPGLILYELCYRAKKKEEQPSHVLEGVFAVLLALILWFILKGAEPFKGGPLPGPAPVPIA
jgi:hypothetical protein